MRTLAEEILTNNRSFVEELAVEYPTYFDTNNLTITQNNYFLVVSKYRLGTAQTHQFQSGEQYGANWHWGSKCTEDNGSITCDEEATAANNALAEMPREYAGNHDSYGNYYDWYSATAESGRFNMNDGVSAISSQATDSICPSGWGLPYSYSFEAEKEKSWEYLLIDIYGLEIVATNGSSDTENVNSARKAPILLSFSGDYSASQHSIQNNRNFGFYWTRSATSTGYATDLSINRYGRLNPRMIHVMIEGENIRCVKE